MLNLDVYHGVEANVTSYLFTDNNIAVLVDCLRNSEEAAKLAEFVKSTGKHLTRIPGHAERFARFANGCTGDGRGTLMTALYMRLGFFDGNKPTRWGGQAL